MAEEAKKHYYHTLFYGQTKDVERLLTLSKEISLSLYMLTYAVYGNQKEVEKILVNINRDEIEGFDKLAYLEADLSLDFFQKEYPKAKDKAEQIIRQYPEAFYANYILGHIARIQKKQNLALEYYEKLLKTHPEHKGLLLDIASALFFLKRGSDAMKYVKRASPSSRQRMYALLIPLGIPSVRLIFLLTVIGILFLTGLNVYVYIGFVALMGIGCIAWIKKDLLIYSSFLYLAFISTFAWFLSLWIWSLMQGR